MAIMLVFGTSTTYGAWDIEGGWVQRLRKQLDKEQLEDKREYFLIYNLGIDGDTTKGVLERFESEAKRRMCPDEETILVFSVGTNDSITDQDGKKRVEIKDFEMNIKKIIEKSRKITDKIIFIGNKPLDESKTNPVSWDQNVRYNNKDGREYDLIIKKICQEESVLFLDIFDKLEKTNFKKYLDDGVHPNSEGHNIISGVVKEFLVNERLI